MSSEAPEAAPEAKEPKRERGKLRVAALLNAGVELFSKKGYEATTMTEIAQLAGASIGSLYQFFPSKEALAEALFNRYAERWAEMLDDVARRAPTASAADLADMLVDTILAVRKEREAKIALSESIAVIVERRKPMRHITREKITRILQQVNGALSDEQATASAAVIVEVMKGLPGLAQTGQDSDRPQPFIAEARTMLTIYIAHVVGR
jgi:AcrR family transcriptional regulator